MERSPNRTQVVLAFPGTGRAGEALQTFRQLDAAGIVRLGNAAVIARDAEGGLFVRETSDLGPPAKRAIISVCALAGFLVGVLWRGVRAGLIGMFVVGESGAILMTLLDPGFSNVYLEQLAAEVPAGSSLLVASVDLRTSDVAAIIQGRFAGARVLRPAPVVALDQPARSST
jgi:uncharacterized membrane protein